MASDDGGFARGSGDDSVPKCVECGHEFTQFADEMIHCGATEGVLSCPHCKAPLLALLPNDCPLCGYFLKKPFGTVIGPLGPACAKCKHPITMKTTAQLQLQSQHAAEIVAETEEVAGVPIPKSSVPTQVLVAVGGLCLVIVVGFLLMNNRTGGSQSPAATNEANKTDLNQTRGALDSTQAEVERLRAEQEAARMRERLRLQAEQEQYFKEHQTVTPFQEKSPANSVRDRVVNPPTSSAAPVDSAASSTSPSEEPPKSASDVYLDKGKPVKTDKGGN